MSGGAAETVEAVEREARAAIAAKDYDGALDRVMRAYGVELHRYCAAMLRDPELIADVHQLVFVQAYESFGGFSERSSIRAWLYGIARHRCLDALKMKRRRTLRFRLVSALPEEADPAPAPDETLHERARARALHHCLQKLSGSVKATLLLRYQAELSYAEMSAATGERATTLQQRVTRALPLLKRCLGERGVEP